MDIVVFKERVVGLVVSEQINEEDELHQFGPADLRILFNRIEEGVELFFGLHGLFRGGTGDSTGWEPGAFKKIRTLQYRFVLSDYWPDRKKYFVLPSFLSTRPDELRDFSTGPGVAFGAGCRGPPSGVSAGAGPDVSALCDSSGRF